MYVLVATSFKQQKVNKTVKQQDNGVSRALPGYLAMGFRSNFGILNLAVIWQRGIFLKYF